MSGLGGARNYGSALAHQRSVVVEQRYRTASGSDRIHHSTLLALWSNSPGSSGNPVAIAPGSVPAPEIV